MSRITRIGFFCLLTALCVRADITDGVAAKNISTIKIQSESLGQQRSVNVLLPLDYEESTNRYPVLYLLHGLGDDHTAWAFKTNLSGYAAAHNIIIVMPDASRSFYVNSAADPKARFEEFIMKDLIPYVDSHFRTIPLRRARAIAGLSMGGYGSAFLGLKHYRSFIALGLFSGALGISHEPPIPAGIPRKTSEEIDTLLGAAGSADRKARDPFALLEKVPAAELPGIYIACGGQDFLLSQNRAFVQMLAEKKLPYEYREVSPRIHEWNFWDEQIPIFLDLLAERYGFGK